MLKEERGLKKMMAGFPVAVKRFIVRCLLVMAIWKLSYVFIFRPDGIIDRPLTNITAATTTQLIKFLSHNDNDIISWKSFLPEDKKLGYVAVISLNQKRQLGIADACNALELMVLYLGFIVCMPSSFKRMLLFGLGGILVIFAINIIRCFIMYRLSVQLSTFFNFAHHYGFTLIVYGIVFFMWIWYAQSLKTAK